MRRNSGLKFFFIIVILIIASVFIIRACNTKSSITEEKFIQTMEAAGYFVFDARLPENTENSTYTSKLANFDDYKSPLTKHVAIYGERSEVIFMVYNNEENAVQVEKRYENAQQLKVYKDDFMSQDYKGDSKNSVRRKGDNYQRYYTKTLTDDYILISQIDNTLLVANISKYDIQEFNKLMIKIGY